MTTKLEFWQVTLPKAKEVLGPLETIKQRLSPGALKG